MVGRPELRGTVFHIMRFSLHDGPGIRTTVFLKGCPLACRWCHNPESQSPLPDILYYPERCLLCGDCIRICPHQAIERRNGDIVVTAACRRCGTCVDTCPADARRLAGRRMTVSEVLAEIERDTPFFDESGGGVTFSGGEPLAQSRFLAALAARCRERGIHTAIETCGFVSRNLALRMSRLVDLVLFDLKLVDSAKHRLYTGAPSEPILRNLAALAAEHANVTVRIPLIPGVNDTAEDLDAFRRFLSEHGMRRVHLLPYHQTGTEKYRRLGLEYTLPEIVPPSPERVQEIREGFEQAGLSVMIGG